MTTKGGGPLKLRTFCRRREISVRLQVGSYSTETSEGLLYLSRRSSVNRSRKKNKLKAV